MTTETPSRNPGLTSRFFNALRSKPSRSKLRKNGSLGLPSPEAVPEFSPLEAHREKYKFNKTLIDSQLGERRDDTALLHGLAHHGSFESIKNEAQTHEAWKPGERMIASLPPRVWSLILDFLTLTDAANLAFSSRTLQRLVGTEFWTALNQAENHQPRVNFLLSMDQHLPNHLLCFPCAKYHLRIKKGQELLKPHQVLNPLFSCPKAATRHPRHPPSKRLTPRRALPFGFLQLALRAQKYTPDYGIPLDSLSRRWKEEAWSHSSRYSIHNNHLFLRVSSTRFAAPALTPSELRLLLYSREDYTPYFSVCAHWRDGKLMDLCKCALSHIPEQHSYDGLKSVEMKVRSRLAGGSSNRSAIVTLCGNCRPVRRCPECPTEYLIEIRLAEDKVDRSFRQAITVTRWSDLGDEKTPLEAEWGACNGVIEGYDSFSMMGKRAISGVFEAGFTDELIPGQRILSLNPKKEKRTEEDDGWY